MYDTEIGIAENFDINTIFEDVKRIRSVSKKCINCSRHDRGFFAARVHDRAANVIIFNAVGIQDSRKKRRIS